MTDNNTKTYTVSIQERSLRVTLPKALADALDIRAGDKIIWKMYQGDLLLRKVK